MKKIGKKEKKEGMEGIIWKMGQRKEEEEEERKNKKEREKKML